MSNYRHQCQNLSGKTVALGITGGIAAYKSAEIVRLLRKKGASVCVMMTENATRFVQPLTFQAVSEQPVVLDLWTPLSTGFFKHIHLAEIADAVVVAPATANLIAKYAHGIADDFLSAFLVTSKAPVIIAPAMNPGMYENAATQTNLDILRGRNIRIVGPEMGEAACGHVGVGRMSEPDVIVDHASAVLNLQSDLKNLSILITAGPTREKIDPVRFISNRSSGLMGFALAAAAVERGADVVCVSGSCHLKPHACVKTFMVDTSQEMLERVQTLAPDFDIIIMAAAVADWTPSEYSNNKIKKRKNDGFTITLSSAPDILKKLYDIRRASQTIVGFAAETESLIENAMQKIQSKKCDIIVANDVSRKDAGFDSPLNEVICIDSMGDTQTMPLQNKRTLADSILDFVCTYRRKKSGN